jgi:hypothetical protein
MFNIASITPITQKLGFTLPNGETAKFKFHVVGQDSRQFKDASKKFATLMLAHEAAGTKPSVDEIQNGNLDMMTACVVGWEDFTEDDGTAIPYSPEAARWIIGHPGTAYIREQVEAYIGQRANFFRKSDQEA